MKYDIITIGGATEDITFYTSEGVLINNKKDLTNQKLLAFEYGAKVKIDKFFPVLAAERLMRRLIYLISALRPLALFYWRRRAGKGF